MWRLCKREKFLVATGNRTTIPRTFCSWLGDYMDDAIQVPLRVARTPNFIFNWVQKCPKFALALWISNFVCLRSFKLELRGNRLGIIGSNVRQEEQNEEDTEYPGKCHHVDSWVVTGVSKKHVVSIFRTKKSMKHKCLLIDMAQLPWQPSQVNYFNNLAAIFSYPNRKTFCL